jgi:RHS repeat-associated protein
VDFAWDSDERLRLALDESTSASLLTATYAADGERITKTDVVTGGHVYSYGLYDSYLQTYYTPRLMQRQSVQGPDRFFHPDWLGSTRYLSNGNGTATPAMLRYDAYGNRSASAGTDPAHPTDFQWAGGEGYMREADTSLGLDYLYQRYYDPAIGRFTSRDPIRWAGGINLFGYCGADPVNRTDGSGTIPVDEIWDVLVLGVDAGFIIYDHLSNAPPSVQALDNAAFTIDLAAAAIPYFPGGTGRGVAFAGRAAAYATARATVNTYRVERAGFAGARGLAHFASSGSGTSCPQGAPPAADYTDSSRSHVFTHGHAANSPRIPGKSRFRPTEGGLKFAEEVVNHPGSRVTQQPNGRWRFDAPDLGRTTGRGSNGRPVRGGRVVLEPNGRVVTQFPQKAL